MAAPADNLDPAEELIAAADRTDAEFIVIGLRRRSPVGKLLLGSNAQRVLLDASCPVLAVKAEEQLSVPSLWFRGVHAYAPGRLDPRPNGTFSSRF